MSGQEHLAQRLQQAADACERGELDRASALLGPVMGQLTLHPGALHLQALIQRGQGRLDAALQSLTAAVRLASEDPQLHCALGNLQRERGDTDRAIQSYQQALRLSPDHRNSLYNLAGAFLASGHGAQAAQPLRRLCALDPEQADSWNLLGIACSDAGQVPEAIEALERSAAIAPRDAEIRCNLGVAYAYAGRGADARRCFTHALELAPRYARAWENLIRSARLTPADAWILERTHALLEEIPADSDSAPILAFALGKGFDDLDQAAHAFRHYEHGNRAVRQKLSSGRSWDEAGEAAAQQALVEAQDRLLQTGYADRPASSLPVFVVGMPRSGTTLVEQMLGAHPVVHGAGELALIPQAASRLHRLPGGPAAGDVEAQAQRIIEEMSALAPRAMRVVDKLPGNWLHLGSIRAMFPGAAIVHCRRHPLDTCVSIYFQRFVHGHAYAYDEDTIANQYLRYVSVMQHWQDVLAGGIIDVQYESLVRDPEATARRLARHIGVDFDPGMLCNSNSGTAVRTASSWQVREPIHSRSIGRWKRYEPFIGVLTRRLAHLC